MEDRHQQHAERCHVVKPHKQRAGEEQRDEPDNENYGCRDQRLHSPAFFSGVVGHVPHRPREGDVQSELHGVIPVLPMMLQKSGESDLLSKLKQHQLEQKDRGHLSQRSQPATRRYVSARGPKIASEISVAPTGTVNSATKYQRSGTRQRTLRRARSTTPSRPASAPVTTNAARPTPSRLPRHPCSGKSNAKTSASAIGRIAAVKKPAPRPITIVAIQ